MSRSTILAVLVTMYLALSPAVSAQTTEFAYQGSLQNGTVPANGNHDFEFLLFDSLSGGTQLGSPLTRNAVAVSAGVFSVKLDFGGQFPGANRFLEIRVRQTGGGAFTPLTPRQAVNSSPYSVQSLNAGNAAQLGGAAANQYVTTTIGNSNYIQNTTSPQAASFNISGTGQIDSDLIANGHVGIGVGSFPAGARLNIAAGYDGNGTRMATSPASFAPEWAIW